MSTPVRRLVIGAAAVSLSVPGALLFDSPISAEQSVSVVATPDTEPPAETTPAEPPAESAPAPQEDDNNWLLFIVLLAVLVAGVAVVLSLLGRNDRRPASASSPVSSDSHREQHNIMGTAEPYKTPVSTAIAECTK